MQKNGMGPGLNWVLPECSVFHLVVHAIPYNFEKKLWEG